MNAKRTTIYTLLSITMFVFAFFEMQAQSSTYTLRVVLVDSLTKEPIEFATVAVFEGGSETVSRFAITSNKGVVEIPGIKRGTHTISFDLMGYRSRKQTVSFTGREAVINIGRVLMQEDVNLLNAAVVSSVGNPIVIKKDTITYNASSYKIADNDMLEDLLKKLPGVEIDSDGKITVNGMDISRVMIDGKPFFENDPTIATKNLSARMVDKVNVVNRKSDQALFTGIDDGNEEMVLDLSIRPGMMNGWFGNLTAGYGTEDRYQANGMVGRFQDGNQAAFLGNINNTNNRGFMDAMAGNMSGMRGGGGGFGGGGGRGGGGFGGGGMGGGGGVRFGGNMMNFGGNGITTSWNAGTNLNGEFFDKKLKVGGNYFYGGSETVVESESDRRNFLPDSSYFIKQNQNSTTRTENHRVGMEIDYSINERNSILFRPNASFGSGRMNDESKYASAGEHGTKINDGWSSITGTSDSFETRGELLLRHRFPKPGNTISLSINYTITDNSSDRITQSITNYYGENERSDTVNQNKLQDNNTFRLSGRLSYTQPLGGNYYMELAYRYRYDQNNSELESFNYNPLTQKYDIKDTEYSNTLTNTTIEQQADINFQSIQEKYRLTVGFSAIPSYIKSIGETGGVPRDFAKNRFNFTPRVDFKYDFNNNSNLRIEYSGRTNQPSLTQLQTVKDNSDPLNVSEGNLDLTPEFVNRLSLEFRDTKMSTFRTISIRSEINYTLNKIITKSEYVDAVRYSKPVNEGTSFSGNLSLFYNTPIARSKFYVSSYGGVNSSAGNNYSNGVKNHTTTLSINERLRFNYRGSKLEMGVSGGARYSKSWYSIEQNGVNNTWNNSVRADVNWTLPWGLNLLSDLDYIYYIGYPEGYNLPSKVWNASLSKSLFKKKGTLTARVFDILKEAKGISYNMQESYTETTSTNVLTQYFMFSFTYRFGNFGGQQERGNWNRGQGGFGPGSMMMRR